MDIIQKSNVLKEELKNADEVYIHKSGDDGEDVDIDVNLNEDDDDDEDEDLELNLSDALLPRTEELDDAEHGI